MVFRGYIVAVRLRFVVCGAGVWLLMVVAMNQSVFYIGPQRPLQTNEKTTLAATRVGFITRLFAEFHDDCPTFCKQIDGVRSGHGSSRPRWDECTKERGPTTLHIGVVEKFHLAQKIALVSRVPKSRWSLLLV